MKISVQKYYHFSLAERLFHGGDIGLCIIVGCPTSLKYFTHYELRVRGQKA